MKKFRFSLQSVAVQRKLKEDDKRERFAAAVHAYVGAEEALAHICSQIAELEEIIAAGRTGCFRASAQVAFMQALANEQLRKADAAAEVTKARCAMDLARQAWVEARRDVRLLETLETKARLAHRQEGEREEHSLLDDRSNALVGRAR